MTDAEADQRRFDEVAARFNDAEGIEARRRIAGREQSTEMQQQFEFALADVLHTHDCGCGTFDPAADPTWTERVAILMPIIGEHVNQALADQREEIAEAIEAVTWLHHHDRKFVATIARDFGKDGTP